MDSARINEIYNELSLVNVSISRDPRTQGAAYVTDKIGEISDAIKEVNEIANEVERAYGDSRNKVRLLELELKVLLESEITSMDDADVSFQEKQIIAKQAVIARKKAEEVEEARAAGNATITTADIPSLEEQIVLAKNTEESLRALKNSISEKKSELKQLDSAVRLQHNSISEEQRFLGGGIGGGGPTTRNRRGTQTPQTPASWRDVSPEGEETGAQT